MLKFHDISRAGTVSIFLWKNLTSLKRLKFHMHVSDDIVNFGKMLKFHDISRAGTVRIFLWNKSTFLNWPKFHMHVSDDDSNMFCKFDEIWWTLKKCWNFMIFLSAFFYEKIWLLWNGSNFTCMFMMMIPICSASLMKFDELWKKCWNFIFQRASTVGIFPWNKSTSLNRLKFYMHVSDDDSNMFWKFDEILWTLDKCWNFMIFLGPSLSAFFFEIS